MEVVSLTASYQLDALVGLQEVKFHWRCDGFCVVLRVVFLLLQGVQQLWQLAQHILLDPPSSMMLSAVFKVGSGFCGVGLEFWSMEVNVGMTPTITPKVLFWNMMLELKIVYGNVNNSQGNATIIKSGIT